MKKKIIITIHPRIRQRYDVSPFSLYCYGENPF